MDIVIPTFDGIGPNGGSRVLARLATEWVRSGHRVRLFAPYWTPEPYFPTDAETVLIRGRSVTEERAAAPADSSEQTLARLLPGMRAALARHAATADVVLANAFLTAWPTAFAPARALHAYYVQAYETLFVADMTGMRGRVMKALAAGSYRLPLFQIVNSPIYFSYPGIHTQAFVPPGLDLGVFTPSGASPERPSGTPFVVGCIGRREPWKETSLVFDAYERLRHAGRNVRLRVAYSTPDERELPEGAELVVPTSDDELAAFYRSVDVIAAPGSAQLGAPHYPVMEAMACGIPVVTTDYLPADETTAWCVPPGDVLALSAAIESMQDDPSEARARSARGLEAVIPFAWPTVAARMIALLEAERARRGLGGAPAARR